MQINKEGTRQKRGIMKLLGQTLGKISKKNVFK